MFLKRHFFSSLVLLLLLALVATACGNASTSTGSTSPTSTTASSSGAVVQTASTTVGGTAVTILTDTKGSTLYYRTNDTATSVCSGGCAQAWPPLLFSGSGQPTGATTLPGVLGVLNDANGAQVTYQGHPLYTFASDTAPGQVTGQGKGGVWFVATTDLKAGGGSTAPTPTPTKGGY